MSLHQKCPHCSKIAAFVNDFCVLCWSHRIKGAVLSPEQIASSREKYSAMRVAQDKEAAFDKALRAVMVPVVFLILWAIWLSLRTLALCIAERKEWLTAVLPVTCLVGFAVGGYLLGGRRSITLACALLIIAGLLAALYFGASLYHLFSTAGLDLKAFIFYAGGLGAAGFVMFGAIRILRTERPVA